MITNQNITVMEINFNRLGKSVKFYLSKTVNFILSVTVSLWDSFFHIRIQILDGLV